MIHLNSNYDDDGCLTIIFCTFLNWNCISFFLNSEVASLSSINFLYFLDNLESDGHNNDDNDNDRDDYDDRLRVSKFLCYDLFHTWCLGCVPFDVKDLRHILC